MYWLLAEIYRFCHIGHIMRSVHDSMITFVQPIRL